MAIIGEAFIAIRPLVTGFGLATKAGVDKELGAVDLFGGVRSQSTKVTHGIEDDFANASHKSADAVAVGTSKISSLFDHAGATAASWGIPFASSLQKVGDKIDTVEGKGKKFGETLSTMGGLALGAGTILAAGIGAESVHLAAGLAQSDGQIASHENISVKAAANIGKAFESSAGTTIFSANQQSAAFAPIAGELAQISGHALTTGQSLKFMADSGDLAEATGSDLATTTSTVASIMQGFQIPLKGTTQLTNELFNTSRVTGTGVGQLGNVIDRLKARLGVAAPTVADLSSLLVDLNEHGVQGSRGLLVVNSAVNTLLQSVPKVDAAAAKAANSLSTKLGAANQTVANAQTALANAQAAAATKVQNAQTALADEQDRVNASATASAPTTSQQIALQNAQTRVSQAQASATQSVTAAQTRLSQAQGKVVAVGANAAASTNAQVLAMQQLGLQVYNSAGEFVGMRDIIAQLQPKLEGMTQQQQLATLTQVFGASASKALLATVLAGPAAYDKAHDAVTKSSTAHKGAAEQNQNFVRQLDILKAALIDEGDKIGTYLIPKIEDLGHWTVEGIKWGEKHKKVVEDVAFVIGGVLAIAIGAFVVNTGAKFIRFLGDGINNLEKFSNKVAGTSFNVQTSAEQQAAVQQASADKVAAAQAEMASAAAESAGAVTRSMDDLNASIAELSATIQSSLDKAGASFSAVTGGAEGANVDTRIAMGGVLSTVETDSGLIIASNERTAASFELIPAGAAGALAKTSLAEGELAGATAKTGGLADLRAAPAAALAPEAEVAAGGFGLAAAKGILTSGAGKLMGGLIGVQLYNTFAEKDVGKVIGTKAASVLGDVATGATIGTAIAGPFGTVAGGVLGAVFSQRADFGIIAHNEAIIRNDAKEQARDEKIIKAVQQANKTQGGSVGTETARDTVLGNQLTVLQQLQANARQALAQHGPTSQQFSAAQTALITTEQKWLPGLAKGADITKVTGFIAQQQGQLFLANLHLQALAKDGTLSQSNTHLASLKTTLAQQQSTGASESTLKLTQGEINETKNHIQDLKETAKHITKETTAISKADALKAEMTKVNGSILALKNQIATTPPPPGKLGGNVKLVPTK